MLSPSNLALALVVPLFAAQAAAQTFAPALRASIKDSPRDGLGDSFNTAPFEGLMRQTASVEERAIQEFDLSALAGATIQSATLSGKVSVNNAFDNGTRTFAFSLYAGNGVADLSDFQIAATQVGTGQYAPPLQSNFLYSFDVTSTLQTLLSGGATFVGLQVDCTSEPSFPNILDDAMSQLVVVTTSCGNVASFCTPGTTSSGCLATMSGVGAPDANAGSGFVIGAANVEGQRQGLIFYGIDNAGFTPLPWGLNSSFLCVKPPTQRLPGASTGGTAGACDGALSVDFNAFMAANPTALGGPFTGGESVYAQAWFRDPPSPKTTNLSDGLAFVVCP
jgi:hypothetical protein